MITFPEMPYERPDPEALKEKLRELTSRLQAAKNYTEARAIFLEKDQDERHVDTLATLASVRHSIDTRDAFYDAETSSGIKPVRNCRSLSRPGQPRCWRRLSARILRRSSAISCSSTRRLR